MTPEQEAIVREAEAAGEDPAYALAVAERESNFNPNTHNSVSIHGMYQMRGDLRQKYGVGDSNDPSVQARGWMRSLPDIRRDMHAILGRDPTDQEAYLGHHYGAKRAAKTLTMDPNTPTDAVFTPREMAANPHFAQAGTIGNLNASVMGDIGKRMDRFGGGMPPSSADLSSYGEDSEPADLSAFGTAAGDGTGAVTPPAKAAAKSLPDLSAFGEAA